MMTAAKRYLQKKQEKPVQPHCTLNAWNNLREGVEYTFGLYSALRACNAMVFKSRRQSRLTVATMFLFRVEKKSQPKVSLGWGHKETQGFEKQTNMGDTHCKVGTMPLGLFWVAAPGVATGVAGVTPLPSVAFPPAGS
jgi:hypothetical protein